MKLKQILKNFQFICKKETFLKEETLKYTILKIRGALLFKISQLKRKTEKIYSRDNEHYNFGIDDAIEAIEEFCIKGGE